MGLTAADQRGLPRRTEIESVSGSFTVASCAWLFNAYVKVDRPEGSMRGRNEQMPEYRWFRLGQPIWSEENRARP